MSDAVQLALAGVLVLVSAVVVVRHVMATLRPRAPRQKLLPPDRLVRRRPE